MEDISSCLPSEEEGQKRSGKIQSLVAIVIPIIQLPPPQCSLQQPVNHVPGEEEEEEERGREGGEEERRVTHCRGQQVSVPPSSSRASPQEVSLLGLTEAADPNMRKQLLLQYVLGILDPVVPGHPGLSSSHTDEVEGHILFLNHKGLVK